MWMLKKQQEAARPAEVKEIWGLYRRDNRAFVISTALQTLVVLTLFALASSNSVQTAVSRTVMPLVAPNLSAYQPRHEAPKSSAGGGGGGDRSVLPASQGKLPKPSLRQFTPPEAVVRNLDPKLAMEPSILAPPDVPLPSAPASNYGVVEAAISVLSNGTGSGSGIGSGAGGGVGSGNGAGAGPGSGGGVGGGVFQIGGGVTPPAALVKVEPEYSDEARRAKHQGLVIVYAEVAPDGRAHNPRIVRSLGLGLDEKALEALAGWRFRPATKSGKPVTVALQVEFTFRLL